MKNIKILLELAAAAAAIAGIAFLVVKYFDQIKAWLQKLCPCCKLEDDFVPDDEIVSAVPPVEDDEDEEAVPVADEVVDDSVPVADDADFEA